MKENKITPEETNLDGYDLRYQFAISKGFRLVSDALDKWGFKGFEEKYQQSLL